MVVNMSAKKRCFRSELFRPKKIPLKHPVEQTPAEEKWSSKNGKDALVNVQASSKQAFLEK